MEDKPKSVKSGDAAVVKLAPQKPMVVDPFSNVARLAGFLPSWTSFEHTENIALGGLMIFWLLLTTFFFWFLENIQDKLFTK